MLGSNNSSLAFRIKFLDLDLIVCSTLAEAVTAEVNCLSAADFICDVLEIPRILGEAGIRLIEGLQLPAARPRDYELACLPLQAA